MYKNIFLSFCFLSWSIGTLQAQELGLHFMNNVWQANQTNPAIAPNQKVIFAFPNTYTNFTHSALSFNDMVSTDAEGVKRINANQLLAGLQEQNYFKAQATVESFHFALAVANMQFSLHHAVKSNGLIRYPKALAQLALEGNAALIGQEVDIAPSFDFMAYNEIGVGFNMRLAGLAVGGRIKLLNGLASINTEAASIRLRTDEEIYQLQVNSNFEFNTAGALALDIDGDEVNTDFNLDDYSFGDFFKINRGWAIDLGATYKVNDQLTVAASIIDLGFIGWKDNARNFKSSEERSFDGFDLDDIIVDNSLELGASVDSIFDSFEFTETENKFTTMLPSKIYLSGTYRILPVFRAGALLYLENQPGKSFSALALNGTVDLGNICSLGLVYSIYNRSYANIGLNMQLKLGPVQIFAASDNVIAVARPGNSRGTNARVGLNLAFGKRGITLPVVGTGN